MSSTGGPEMQMYNVPLTCLKSAVLARVFAGLFPDNTLTQTAQLLPLYPIATEVEWGSNGGCS